MKSIISSAVCLALVIAWLSLNAGAIQAASAGVKTAIYLDKIGDARFNVAMKLPAYDYTYFKKNTTNTALLLRRRPLPRLDWWELEDFKVEFEDSTSTVNLKWKVRGLARASRDQRWECPLEGLGELEPLAIQDNLAVFTSPGAAISLYAPEASKELKLLKEPARLAYVAAPGSSDGLKADADFRLQTKGQVMSCLAKAHGNPKFSSLWIARGVFKNTGQQTLKDYRVRFRFGEYASWSEWRKCDRVVPGQSVVDPYFPVFDLDRVSRLTSTGPVELDVEYQYQQPDGQVMRETADRRVQLLGHNEVLYSSMKYEELVDNQDWFDMDQYILPSLVKPEDPILQQVTGWVAGQAGGVAAIVDDKQAMKFLESLFLFMSGNRIAYQSPTGGNIEGRTHQHVKYGRDVMRNRAGTCIDLAIFYASCCQATGLKPILHTIPGHCFCAIRLPSGKLVAVEATMVTKFTFDQAVKRGQEELDDIVKKGLPHSAVDVQAMHDLGVRAPELPALPTSALNDWGIKPIKELAPRTNDIPNKLVGLWRYDHTVGHEGKLKNQTSFYQVNADGTANLRRLNSAGKVVNEGPVSVSYENDLLVENNTEYFRVIWLDKDIFKLKCAKSGTDKKFVGYEYLYRRVVEGQDTSHFVPDWLVGDWKADYRVKGKKKGTFRLHQNLDGSYKSEIRDKHGKRFGVATGMLTYVDGVVHTKWKTGWEIGEVNFMNWNKFTYDSKKGVPKNMGDKYVFHRLK